MLEIRLVSLEKYKIQMSSTASEIVPFVDLQAQYQTIKEDIDSAIADVIGRSLFVRGPYVDSFEDTFASTMERKHCVSCANGTDSLYIAMKALGVKEGDEVIAPAHSWISTTETITQAGGTVVFCDTDRDLYTIDPEDIEAKVTDKTVGIIPVHLFGQAADMDAVMAIARKHNLWVLEDCAQAHLARFKGKLVGTFGDVASFSFYPGKNLGAMGDGGAVLTDDDQLARKMAMFARHGGLRKGDHQIEGINSRLDGLQAAVLTVKLGHLQKWTTLRQRHAERYCALFSGFSDITLPAVGRDNEPVWHLFVIRHENRDELAQQLKQHNVQTVVNYPIALPFLPAYQRFGHVAAEFPNAHYNQSRILSLPIFPEMSDAQLVRVADVIKSFDIDGS